jgi:hypothetical protein
VEATKGQQIWVVYTEIIPIIRECERSGGQIACPWR